MFYANRNPVAIHILKHIYVLLRYCFNSSLTPKGKAYLSCIFASKFLPKFFFSVKKGFTAKINIIHLEFVHLEFNFIDYVGCCSLSIITTAFCLQELAP